ncbi:hypothetical protein DNTS_025863 [Danionella cerebrum]|uniref:Uncharacterized protein n=1 Tax=Danionella cerebrum TaxID=2873325 RepID=A0A553NA86_9TELE|nr:hypothetical protein DNTS_025863 [Danionella translucida]
MSSEERSIGKCCFFKRGREREGPLCPPETRKGIELSVGAWAYRPKGSKTEEEEMREGRVVVCGVVVVVGGASVTSKPIIEGLLKPEQWAENRVGELVGVCLCGIRQGLACVTRATRKFPGCSCFRAEPCPRTQAGSQGEGDSANPQGYKILAGRSGMKTGKGLYQFIPYVLTRVGLFLLENHLKSPASKFMLLPPFNIMEHHLELGGGVLDILTSQRQKREVEAVVDWWCAVQCLGELVI